MNQPLKVTPFVELHRHQVSQKYKSLTFVARPGEGSLFSLEVSNLGLAPDVKHANVAQLALAARTRLVEFDITPYVAKMN